MKNFALTGAAGYIAPRHLRAIKDTGNRLVAAVDPHDSVGILDSYFPDCSFFTEFERFDRHIEKLRRGPEEGRVQYLSICTPNYLHDAHIRFALRVGAHAICEKPLVIKPWNLDALQELQEEYGGKISTVLQLRLHPAFSALKRELAETRSEKKRDICLSYVTSRGTWYQHSWKGSPERSGGVAANIGIHFFDLLQWLFGGEQTSRVHLSEPTKMAGTLELENANVRWFLSIDSADLPSAAVQDGKTTYRSLTIDGREIEFSDGFGELHTRVYVDILAGGGYGIEDVRPSIELVYNLRNAKVTTQWDGVHPFLLKPEFRRRNIEVVSEKRADSFSGLPNWNKIRPSNPKKASDAG